MPYTKRKAHHYTINDLIDYIVDEEKTDGGLLVTGHNCNPDFAKKQFNEIQEKYHNEGNRVGYHLIQSFAPDDDISPEQAHEIGVRLAKELYPNFQAVISTHIDKGHIHNHIALNSVSLNGRKLVDKRNHQEGLRAFQKKSDEIAAEYGCYIMPETNLDYSNPKKDLYQSYKKKTWRQQAIEDMNKLQFSCNDMEQFVQGLFDLGYDIKYGKYIAIKPIGAKRYIRLKTLAEKFDEDNLRLYFAGKEVDYFYKFNKYNLTRFNEKYLEYYHELEMALKITSTIALQSGSLPQFSKTKRKAEIQAEKVENILKLLDKANINSFDELEEHIRLCRNKIKAARIDVKKFERENSSVLDIIDKCQTFLVLKRQYDIAMYYKSLDDNYVLPSECRLYEELSNELGITTTEEARKLLSSARQTRIELNKLKSTIYEREQELYQYDLIKEEQLIKSGLFVHNIKVGNERIDYSNCTDKMFCVNLPYSDYYIMIDKAFTTYNHKYGFNTLFLVDDKSYQLYTKTATGKLQEAEKISGEQIENFVDALKKQQIEKHKNINNDDKRKEK